MDRLTRRELWWGSRGKTDKAINYKVDEEIRCVTHEGSPDFLIADKLAEYEDLEEQGKLLKLPVPIGEEMFFVYMDCPKDYKEEYCKDHEGYCEKCPHREPSIMNRAFSFSDIPNLHKIRAYSTMEQAERALAEMEGKK